MKALLAYFNLILYMLLLYKLLALSWLRFGGKRMRFDCTKVAKKWGKKSACALR